jgi:D-sedoheptulose 7-phosphate isomerase
MRSKEEPELTVLLSGHLDASHEVQKELQRALDHVLASTSTLLDKFAAKPETITSRKDNSQGGLGSSSANQIVGRGIEVIESHTPAQSVDDGDWLSPGVSEVSRFVSKYTAGLMQVMQKVSVESISQFVDVLLRARAEDKQIFIIGNGGSASLASHLATDLIKERFPDPRYLFRVMSLTDSASTITATANDFGYDLSFVNQLKPWVREGDVVVAISSSGNSANIVKALEYASDAGARTVGLLGFDGGKAASLVNTLVQIPCGTGQYGFAEDATSVIAHMITVMIFEHDRKNFELTRPSIKRASKKNSPAN